MPRKEYIFTSESYSEGNPDKVADMIADAIVDSYIEKDKNSIIDVNVIVTNQKVIAGGSIKSDTDVNIDDIIRKTIKDIGYTDKSYGLDYSNCVIEDYIERKSKTEENKIDINDIKIMFGFAVSDSDAFIPLTITLAHSIVKKHSQIRKEQNLSFLLPEAKSQVTCQYDSKGKPKKIDTIVYTANCSPNIKEKELKDLIMEEIIKKTLPNSLIDKNTEIHIIPIKKNDNCISMGISGRKTISDTYGCWSRHGDLVLSGKGPLSLERAVSYMLRKISKNIIASGMAKKVEIQAAYAPGIEKPVALYVDTFDSGKLSDDKVSKKILDIYNLTPFSIAEELELLLPKYKKTACYGHFGRHETSFTWEMIDIIDDLK